MLDGILPRKKKCKYGNKILMYNFHRLYINIYIYMREKNFHIKRFYSLCISIFDVGFGFGFFFLPFFSVACCTADVLGLLKKGR